MTAMTLDHAFVQSIVEHPADDAPRLIYADWLQERGDAESAARAEFIRLQCLLEHATEADPCRPAWQARMDELLGQHGRAWSQGVRGRVSWYGFRRGFIAEVRLTGDQLLAHAEALFRQQPLEAVTVLAGGDQVERLADCPYLPRVQRLEFRGHHPGDAGVRRLDAAGCLEQLTALVLHGCALSSASAEVVASVPFHTLTYLDLGANEVGDQGLGWLAMASSLRSLRILRLGANELGPAGVEALAASPHLGDLEEINLGPNYLDDAAVTQLARAPLLASLRRLDLRSNSFGDEGARALAASPYLRDLTWLDVSHNELTPAGELALQSRFGDRVHL